MAMKEEYQRHHAQQPRPAEDRRFSESGGYAPSVADARARYVRVRPRAVRASRYARSHRPPPGRKMPRECLTA